MIPGSEIEETPRIETDVHRKRENGFAAVICAQATMHRKGVGFYDPGNSNDGRHSLAGFLLQPQLLALQHHL